MASRGLEEHLDRARECPVCLEMFDDPKLLPCQHTFCAHCLRNIEDRGNVMCPECRAVHRVPAAGFPNNITIQRLLSASLMPNVPSTTEPSFARVQPTAPPIEPSTRTPTRGIQPAVYTLNATHQPPPWHHGHLTDDYNGYHGNAAPYETTRPQARTQPFANFQNHSCVSVVKIL